MRDEHVRIPHWRNEANHEAVATVSRTHTLLREFLQIGFVLLIPDRKLLVHKSVVQYEDWVVRSCGATAHTTVDHVVNLVVSPEHTAIGARASAETFQGHVERFTLGIVTFTRNEVMLQVHDKIIIILVSEVERVESSGYLAFNS